MWNSLNSSAISIILVDESDLVGSLIDLAVTTVGLIFPLTDEVILYVERSIPIHRRYQLGISILSLDNIISVLFDVSKSLPCTVYVLLWKYYTIHFSIDTFKKINKEEKSCKFSTLHFVDKMYVTVWI